MRLDLESTVCAIATGAEGACRGAIRITGPNSVSIAECTCLADSHPEQSNSPWQSKRAIRFETAIELQSVGVIPVAIYLWPDTRSYTSQPSVEVHTVGNVVILREIQAKLIRNGCQLAEPGEFTLRAFLAGRLDLPQCEAVLGVIHAANERSLHVALKQLAGGLSGPLLEVRTSLIHLLADIEAGLDFVDEDIEFVSQSQILDRLASAQASTANLLEQIDARGGQTFELQVALVGPPNAGKSSLLNAIANEHVAIVSDVPGTTRDYVCVRLNLDGVPVDLIDTAGIEAAEKHSPRGMAQQTTRNQIQKADLVIQCQAANESLSRAGARTLYDPFENRLAPQTQPEQAAFSHDQMERWLVMTKCDLAPVQNQEHLMETQAERKFLSSIYQPESVQHLLDSLSRWARERYEQTSHVVPLTAVRCKSSLEKVQVALANASIATKQASGDEITASEIRLALDEIGVVTGTVYNDDILDALFSRFCIGK